jgi:hypothetical protein
MSFLVAAALAVGLLVAVPIVAHLLRRGRTREQAFPPAALVPLARSVARQRSRLEDRALLALRAAIIVALAMLGATPLVRCSRLALGREAGASVALALIVDDSLSMRATAGGSTRWDRALRGAKELLDSAREGDAVAVVLAGRPARLALSATTDLGAARRALGELRPSDRATDLEGAIGIGRSSLAGLPHKDKRIVLLSDLASNADLGGEPRVWAPIAELSAPADDCGIIGAERRGRRIQVAIACNAASAAAQRSLRAVGAAGETRQKPAGSVLAEQRLAARSGVQTFALEIDAEASNVEVELTGTDALARDDRAAVLPESSALLIGVSTDPERSSAITGGPPLIEQALASLNTEAVLRPLSTLPQDGAELRGLGAIVVDDPAGLTPEARSALTEWLDKGGVALALLGPRARNSQLGATLEPFAQGAVPWQKTDARGADAASLSWLGAEAPSLTDLAPRGRAILDGAELPGARVAGRWDDGKAWLLERSSGRGLAFTLGLPSSLDSSDLALRPGFLALLDRLVAEALERSGPRQSPVGAEWTFPAKLDVLVLGPEGPLTVDESSGPVPQKRVSLALLGKYQLKIDGETQIRVATPDREEITTLPQTAPAAAAASANGPPRREIDASRELSLILIALVVSELLLRGLRTNRAQRATA